MWVVLYIKGGLARVRTVPSGAFVIFGGGVNCDFAGKPLFSINLLSGTIVMLYNNPEV